MRAWVRACVRVGACGCVWVRVDGWVNRKEKVGGGGGCVLCPHFCVPLLFIIDGELYLLQDKSLENDYPSYTRAVRF